MKKKVEREKTKEPEKPKKQTRKLTKAIKLFEQQFNKGGYLEQKNSNHYSRSIDRYNIVKQIYVDLLNGSTYTKCIEKLKSGECGRPYTTIGAQKIYNDARKLVMMDFEAERPQLKEQLYTYLRDTYSECREKGDRYNAILAINSIAKLVGLTDNKQQSIQVTSEGPVTIKFGFDDTDEQPNQITDTNYEIIEEDGT